MPTLVSAKSGMYFDTGSVERQLALVDQHHRATLVIGLVMEWSAKIVSGVIGSPVATSRTPKHLEIDRLAVLLDQDHSARQPAAGHLVVRNTS